MSDEQQTRTTAAERKQLLQEHHASVASLGSGYQTELMTLAVNLCGDLEDATATIAALVGALEAIAEGRTLVMDDLGETFAEALQRDARAALSQERKQEKTLS